MGIPKEAGKTIMVTIVKEDKNGDRKAFTISGEEAEEWNTRLEGQIISCFENDIDFPEIKRHLFPGNQ